jgi:hypothetical protein
MALHEYFKCFVWMLQAFVLNVALVFPEVCYFLKCHGWMLEMFQLLLICVETARATFSNRDVACNMRWCSGGKFPSFPSKGWCASNPTVAQIVFVFHFLIFYVTTFEFQCFTELKLMVIFLFATLHETSLNVAVGFLSRKWCVHWTILSRIFQCSYLINSMSQMLYVNVARDVRYNYCVFVMVLMWPSYLIEQ